MISDELLLSGCHKSCKGSEITGYLLWRSILQSGLCAFLCFFRAKSSSFFRRLSPQSHLRPNLCKPAFRGGFLAVLYSAHNGTIYNGLSTKHPSLLCGWKSKTRKAISFFCTYNKALLSRFFSCLAWGSPFPRMIHCFMCNCLHFLTNHYSFEHEGMK